MKKILSGVLLMAACYISVAQVVTPKDTTYTVQSVSVNQGYFVPEHIRMNFETTYPMVYMNSNWEPVYDFWTVPVTTVSTSTELGPVYVSNNNNVAVWRASYTDNNRLTQVYYTGNGSSYLVARPVLVTYVPEEVITAAINQYGSNLYSITALKPVGMLEVYQVGLLDNGTPRTIYMDPLGIDMTETYPAKLEEAKLKIEQDKIKIKSDDEKLKMKMNPDEI
jgi:hypothetical protein